MVCRIKLSAPVPVPFLCSLDFGFETLDLDLVLEAILGGGGGGSILGGVGVLLESSLKVDGFR